MRWPRPRPSRVDLERRVADLEASLAVLHAALATHDLLPTHLPAPTLPRQPRAGDLTAPRWPEGTRHHPECLTGMYHPHHPGPCRLPDPTPTTTYVTPGGSPVGTYASPHAHPWSQPCTEACPAHPRWPADGRHPQPRHVRAGGQTGMGDTRPPMGAPPPTTPPISTHSAPR